MSNVFTHCRPEIRIILLLAGGVISQGLINGAEIVYRKSDPTKISGDIQEVTRKGILLKPAKGDPLRVDSDDIQQIQWEGEPLILRSARNADLAGRLDTALEGYRAALKDLREDQKYPIEDVEFGLCRCLEKQAVTNLAAAPQAVEELEAFLKKHSESRHFYEATLLLGQMHQALNQNDRATADYQQLKNSGIGSYPLQGDLGLARIAFSGKQYSEARTAFQAVLDAPLKGELIQLRQQEARMGLAAICRVEQKYDEGIGLLQQVIENSSPDETQLLANAYLEQGNCYQAGGRIKEALIAYLHVDLIFPQESGPHSETLYHLSGVWQTLQHPDRGAEARDRLLSLYPESQWAKLPMP